MPVSAIFPGTTSSDEWGYRAENGAVVDLWQLGAKSKTEPEVRVKGFTSVYGPKQISASSKDLANCGNQLCICCMDLKLEYQVMTSHINKKG